MNEEAEALFQSERISAAQAAYDKAMKDYDPTEPDHEVQAFDAMKAAIESADAMDAARFFSTASHSYKSYPNKRHNFPALVKTLDHLRQYISVQRTAWAANPNVVKGEKLIARAERELSGICASDNSADLVVKIQVLSDGTTICKLQFGDGVQFDRGCRALVKAVEALALELAESSKCPSSKAASRNDG